MCNMLFRILGVDQNVIQIDYHAHIQHVRKNAIDKALERSQSVGKSERHNKPFIGAIASAEGSFPFITWSNADQMVCMSEIDLGIDGRMAGGIKEVGDERKWITIFFGDFIETAEVHTKMERSILFLDKKDWSSMGGVGRTNEPIAEMLIYESAECFKLGQR